MVVLSSETKLFLSYAEDLGLPYFTHECVPGKPIMIMTWQGEDPSLSSVILNSHTDVVPVFPEVIAITGFGHSTSVLTRFLQALDPSPFLRPQGRPG